jgi:L-Ala-D/L-Glu epimerase
LIRSQAVRKILQPRHVFRIARGAKPLVENVFLALEQNGLVGYGEASPNAFYGETPEDVHMRLLGLADWLKRQTLRSPQDIALLWYAAQPLLAPSRAAQCALDLALWDLAGKMAGVSVCDLVHSRPPLPVLSSATLGLGNSEEQLQYLQELQSFQRIKVKLDSQPNWERLRHMQAMHAASWAFDANAAWSWEQLQSFREALSTLTPSLLEQPLAPENDGHLEGNQENCAYPLYADESLKTVSDLPGLKSKYQGVNIKLVKCGGLTPALALLKEARNQGFQIMVGCMLESSLLISAGLVVAQNADWADLDGSWLLQNDPFQGLAWQSGWLRPSQNPGFGVHPKGYPL